MTGTPLHGTNGARASGAAVKEVTAFVLEQLSAWKVPARFQLIEAVPRTGSGKTQRRRLFELT